MDIGPPDAEAEAVQESDGVSVGRAAALVGVSPSTLRGWGRRYGLVPSGRTPGGHRRYTAEDLDTLLRMRARVVDGLEPAQAAGLARTAGASFGTPVPEGEDGVAAPAGPARRGGPGGRVLAVPGGSREARGLARAAAALDVDGVTALLERVLARDGVISTWDGLLRPVFQAAGSHWERTGRGIETEHLLTEAAVEALRHHRRSLEGRRGASAPPTGTTASPVVLACAPGDLHALPLHALAAALAEAGTASRTLGPRVPWPALWATVQRLRARAVFVWAQARGGQLRGLLDDAPVMRPVVRIVVGGPGWDGTRLPVDVARSTSLTEAVRHLAAPPLP